MDADWEFIHKARIIAHRMDIVFPIPANAGKKCFALLIDDLLGPAYRWQ